MTTSYSSNNYRLNPSMECGYIKKTFSFVINVSKNLHFDNIRDEEEKHGFENSFLAILYSVCILYSVLAILMRRF